MSLALLLAVFVIVWKFYGPVVRWREKREYEKMRERSYRPALDNPSPREKGFGISNDRTNRASIMSFLAMGRPRQQIKRKPVPRGVSPLISPGPLVKVDKVLPSLPE
jgi:hypothetical protein